MKGTRTLSLAIVAAAAAGCGGTAPAPAPAAVPEEPPAHYAFGAKSPIPVRMTLLATGEGGRVAPLSGGYRPSVVFDAATPPVTCSIGGTPADGFDPGETHEVVLRCAGRVSVRPDATGFTVREGGQMVGSGVVLP